jgi:hypothetical protein
MSIRAARLTLKLALSLKQKAHLKVDSCFHVREHLPFGLR